MPEQGITVERRATPSWLERLGLPAVLRALRVTTGRFVGQLRGAEGAAPADALPGRADAFRGMPVLVQRPDGTPRCVACGDCAVACPTECIRVTPDARGAATPARFDLDLARCLFCGACEEACPEQAIVMSREVAFAGFDRGSLRFAKEQLLVPEELVARRIAFLRADAARARGESA